jgi:hypothetical protein
MTVNERPFDAGLFVEYGQTVNEGDRVRINAILAKVDLWQDDSGMNWTLASKRAAG